MCVCACICVCKQMWFFPVCISVMNWMRFMLLSGLEYLFLLSVGQIYFGLVTGLDLIQRQVIALSSQIEWKVYKQSPLVVKSSEVSLLQLCTMFACSYYCFCPFAANKRKQKIIKWLVHDKCFVRQKYVRVNIFSHVTEQSWIVPGWDNLIKYGQIVLSVCLS